MFYGRTTRAIELVHKAIKEGKTLDRRSMHIKVKVFGKYYYVQHWSTRIAVGVVGEMPFAMRTNGWNTATTLNLLRQLGFELWTRRMRVGEYRDETTHRVRGDYRRVLHVNGQPMMHHGKVDYESWYDKAGMLIGDKLGFIDMM